MAYNAWASIDIQWMLATVANLVCPGAESEGLFSSLYVYICYSLGDLI